MVDLTAVNLVNTGRALVEGEEVLVTWGDRTWWRIWFSESDVYRAASLFLDRG